MTDIKEIRQYAEAHVEIKRLTEECDAFKSDVDTIAQHNIELMQEHISLVAALTTIGDASAGTSAMELQIFARNVLKGLKS